MRTDDNNNPTAFTTALALTGNLSYGTDYIEGTQFPGEEALWTAKILGDPLEVTIKLIDAVGYYTFSLGAPRWTYIAIPKFIWSVLTRDQKVDVIGFHYQREGGTTMRNLFPNYGKS